MLDNYKISTLPDLMNYYPIGIKIGWKSKSTITHQDLIEKGKIW